jgi:hypothetical protein
MDRISPLFLRLASCLLALLSVSSAAWSEDWTYRIREGENLTLIAQRFMKPEFTPQQLQAHNRIEKDRKIPIGTGIRIPINWLRDLLVGVKVSYIMGQAGLYRASSPDKWIKLEPKAVLNAGDRIKTESNSVVALTFADNTTLMVGEKSEVVFDALSTFQGKGILDTQIRLQRGRLENNVKPLKNPESRYEIHTPAAVTVVRGTAFRVAVTGSEGLTRTEVTKGHIDVSAQGTSVQVNQGEGIAVEPGSPPAEPRKLLPEPELADLQVSQTNQEILLNWPDLDRAVSYRSRLKNAQGEIVYDGVVTDSQNRLPVFPPGFYSFGVRGVDDWGLEGFEAIKNVHFKAVALPVLQTPLITARSLVFHWTAIPETQVYRFVIAQDPKFEKTIVARRIFGQAFEMSRLAPGQYYIAVEALLNKTGQKVVSKTYYFEMPY